MKQYRSVYAGLAIVLTLGLGACTNSGNPFAPVLPPTDNNVPTNASLKVTTPQPQSPGNAATVDGNSVTLSASGASAPYQSNATLQYEFEVRDSSGNAFDSAVVGSPQWAVSKTLAYSTNYSWRVRARQDDGNGLWSDMLTFRTGDPPVPPAPPSPADEAPECGPPNRTDPESIIQCHRNRFRGHMEPHEALAMLKGAARHMNMAGIPGGPFGILRKNRGNNCNGYSCDIICVGNGRRQKQYDVLIDERIAKFGTPMQGGGIRLDVCEEQ
jgi:hypothetical protein